MIKKLLGICTTLVPLALMNGNVALADTGSYRFTDTSSIRDDITHLGLDYQDYKLISDKNYNRTDVIALSESYIDSGNTKQIVNYVYVYNPYSIKEDVTSFALRYNKSSVTQKVESYTKDYFTNIVKYKIDFRMPTYSDLKRRYEISSLTFSNGSSCNIDFGCTFNQDGSNVQLDYDSYIFITGKELFDYSPFSYYKTYAFSGYNDTGLINYDTYVDNCKSLISNDKKQFLSVDYVKKSWTYFTSRDSVIPDLFFLNFDTNKKIDSINEIDLAYKIVKGSVYDYDINNVDFSDCLKEIDSHIISDDTFFEEVADYSKEYVTLKNENNFFSLAESSNNDYYNWQVSSASINNFAIPAKNRLNDWSNSKIFSNLSDDVLKNSSDKLTARQSFENRQVSILVDILPISIEGNTGSHPFSHLMTKYMIEDLSVMRINYTTDMKVVNARTNSGALISSVNANDNTPKVSFWERLIAWFNDNFPYSLLIIGGAIIGLPIIISIVISLFTSGSSALLSGIGKGISKLVTSLIKGLVKLLVGIISLPFKFLGALFSPKKNNSNNSSKKK